MKDSFIQRSLLMRGLTIFCCIDWYSSGAYYLTESLTDVIPVTISAAVCAVITFFVSNQLNEGKRFWAYFYTFQLIFHTINELAHFMAIILFGYETICILLSLLLAVSTAVLSNLYVQVPYMPIVIKYASNISI